MKIQLTDEEIRVGNTNYLLNGTITISEEKNYGADADGNRGVTMHYLDDHDLEILNDDDIAAKVEPYEIMNVIDYLSDNWRNFI